MQNKFYNRINYDTFKSLTCQLFSGRDTIHPPAGGRTALLNKQMTLYEGIITTAKKMVIIIDMDAKSQLFILNCWWNYI